MGARPQTPGPWEASAGSFAHTIGEATDGADAGACQLEPRLLTRTGRPPGHYAGSRSRHTNAVARPAASFAFRAEVFGSSSRDPDGVPHPVNERAVTRKIGGMDISEVIAAAVATTWAQAIAQWLLCTVSRARRKPRAVEHERQLTQTLPHPVRPRRKRQR